MLWKNKKKTDSIILCTLDVLYSKKTKQNIEQNCCIHNWKSVGLKDVQAILPLFFFCDSVFRKAIFFSPNYSIILYQPYILIHFGRIPQNAHLTPDITNNRWQEIFLQFITGKLLFFSLSPKLCCRRGGGNGVSQPTFLFHVCITLYTQNAMQQPGYRYFFSNLYHNQISYIYFLVKLNINGNTYYTSLIK